MRYAALVHQWGKMDEVLRSLTATDTKMRRLRMGSIDGGFAALPPNFRKTSWVKTPQRQFIAEAIAPFTVNYVRSLLGYPR